MGWMAGYMDLSLVPVVFIFYLGYHIHLVYKTLMLPQTTHFGSEIHQRMLWLQHILQDEVKGRGDFLAEISSSVTLANTYGTYSMTLISVTGVLGTISISLRPVAYGDSSAATQAIKYVSVFVFSLVAFLCFKVGAKTLNYANFLINRPISATQHNYVDGVIVGGFVLIKVGNRSFYFSLVLATWFLGPMPMLVACLILLVGMYIKDRHTIPLEDSNRPTELSPV